MMDTVTITQRHLPPELRGLPCIRAEVAHVIAPGKATPSLEGPIFDRHGNFYCCLTAPNDTYVKKISLDGSISDFFHSDSGMTVGLVFHQDGRCFAADMLRNCIRILSADGKLLEELPLQYEGRKLRPDCMVCIGLVLMFFGGKIIPTWGTVTELGVNMICVFVALLVLITVTNETIWPSLAALVATIFHGYMDAATAAANFIGTSVMLQMIAITVICSALRETGAGQVLAKKMLTVKFIQGKPMAFTIMLLLTFLLADIVLSLFGGIIFSFAMFDSIRDALQLKKNDKYAQAMYIGLYLCGMLGSSILPFSGMPLGITNAFNAAISGYGYSVNPVIYIASALPVGVCFIILYSLSIRYLFRCDMSCLTNLNVDQLESMKNVSTKFNKFQIIYLLSFLVDIGYSFALLLIPKTVSWYGSFASITQAGWFLLVIVVLCIVKIDGKPLMNANKHFKEGSMWGMITAVGIFSMLGGALASNDLGINQWLTEVLGPMFSDMSWPVFVLLIVVVCTVVTNFFSNMATGVIVSSLTAPFAAQYADAGINITVIGTAIAFSSMFAYLTYAAAGPAPLLLGKEGIESKFVWSKGVLALVIYAVAATVVFSLIGYIL